MRIDRTDAAFAGLAQTPTPREDISRWLGSASGLRRPAIAIGEGVVTPGGAFTSFPLVVVLAAAGAGLIAMGLAAAFGRA